MLKQPNFFYSQPCTIPKEALAKFYISTAFGLGTDHYFFTGGVSKTVKKIVCTK